MSSFSRRKATVPHEGYVQRARPQLGRLDEMGERVAGRVQRRIRLYGLRAGRIVDRVGALGPELARMDMEQIRGAAQELRPLLRREGFRPDLVARSFALVREAAHRTISERHFDVQIMGGWVLLNGMVAEMQTGEGKTLTATLAAATAPRWPGSRRTWSP